MIALSNWFENACHDLVVYLFSATRRVHGTLDAGPATAIGVVVDRILQTEDCDFVMRGRRPHACFGRAGVGLIRVDGKWLVAKETLARTGVTVIAPPRSPAPNQP